MAVLASAVSRPTGLLATPSPLGGGRCGRGGCRLLRGRRRFRLAAEELLFTQPQLGFEFGEALLELGFACDGASVHGPPISGFASAAELFFQEWADRTGTDSRRRHCNTSRRHRRRGKS